MGICAEKGQFLHIIFAHVKKNCFLCSVLEKTTTHLFIIT